MIKFQLMREFLFLFEQGEDLQYINSACPCCLTNLFGYFHPWFFLLNSFLQGYLIQSKFFISISRLKFSTYLKLSMVQRPIQNSDFWQGSEYSHAVALINLLTPLQHLIPITFSVYSLNCNWLLTVTVTSLLLTHS